MDKQFTTLRSSYYDNYLQYKLTGNQSYQNSYMSAEQGIQAILSSLQDQINSEKQQVSSFYNTDIEGKLRDDQSKIRNAQRNILKESDAVTAAKMRNEPLTTSMPSVPTSYYISIGVLTAAAVLLSVL